MKRLKWIISIFAFLIHTTAAHSQSADTKQNQLQVHVDSRKFLRQGDHLEFVAKITNLSDKELTGQAQLELMDAATNQSVDGWFQNVFPNQYFTVAARQSEYVKFPMEVPYQFTSLLKWRLTASAETLKEIKEDYLPVFTNQVLVKQSLPLTIKGTGVQKLSFSQLLNAGSSESLQHKSLTVEYNSNPAWFAFQALPYLIEAPAENTEQIWNRLFARLLAAKAMNSAPSIQKILSIWAKGNADSLFYSIQKNEELKAILLKETPWVFEARSEEEQKRYLALLLELSKMTADVTAELDALKELQNSNGSFSWFKGGLDDRYITQYIVAGIGRLKKMNAIPTPLENAIQSITAKALSYADSKLKEDYDNLSKPDLNKLYNNYTRLQYFYMRSFFPALPPSAGSQKAFAYYKEQARKDWSTQNKYGQAMTALAFSRTGDKQTATTIIRSLKAASVTAETTGMYWKDNQRGKSWQWYEAPVEAQSLLIEAFSEIDADTKTTNDLKTWLIQNKHATDWQTTRATADASYALLLEKTNWFSTSPAITVKLGTTSSIKIPLQNDSNAGYFVKVIPADKITPEMGNISVEAKQVVNETGNHSPSHANIYWQYFEDREKATAATLPVKLSQKLFISNNTKLIPVEESSVLHVSDKITAQIELRVEKDIEYVQLKDMFSAALELQDLTSGIKLQNGISYYEGRSPATKTFYFSKLSKGTYTFKYALAVKHAGAFSNGIVTLQSVYAPAFSTYSEGVKITVE